MGRTRRQFLRDGLAGLAALSLGGMLAGCDPDAVFAALQAAIEDVSGATGRRFGTKDDKGRSMDCLKVIASSSSGLFLGVYHTLSSTGKFDVHLAESSDLLHWQFLRTLFTVGSQPTLARLPNGALLLAYETDASNHVRFALYAGESALRAGSVSRTFDAPQSLSEYAEGTPCVEDVSWGGSVDASSFRVSFHYFRNGDVDRQALGTLSHWTGNGTASWSAVAAPDRDQPFLDAGFSGNFGDRDILTFDGVAYRRHEAQRVKGDWGSWRPFLVARDRWAQLNLKTPGGSRSFGNPTSSLLSLGGKRVLFCTLFVFAQGAGAGEAGCLSYYRSF